MAKKKSEDFRDLIMDVIGNTDNFAILRTIANQLEILPFHLNISIFEFHNMLQECLEEMKSCFDKTEEDFVPLKCMSVVSPSTYFKKLQSAYESYKKFEGLESFESIKYRINIEIDNAKEDADLEYASELRRALEKIDDKYAVLEDLIENHIKNKETFYIDYLKGKPVLDTNSDIRLTTWAEDFVETSSVNMADVVFYTKIQESVRQYLISMFLQKKENYFLSLYKSPLKFLCGYDGKVIIDFDHVALLYDFLVSKKASNQHKVKGILYYIGMERIYFDLNDFFNHSIIKGIKLKTYPYNFGASGNQVGYNNQYMSSFILPEGYRGYIFEPKNLLQQSFLSSIISEDGVSLLDSMVSKYTEAQKLMKQHKNGLFFRFLDKDSENRIMPMILSGQVALQYMEGKHTEVLRKEYDERRKKFSDTKNAESNIDVYTKIVLPFSLEVLGSYIRQFCGEMINAKSKDIFVYYMNSHSIGIAVSDNVKDKKLEDIFGPAFLKSLKKVENLTVSEIIENRYF